MLENYRHGKIFRVVDKGFTYVDLKIFRAGITPGTRLDQVPFWDFFKGILHDFLKPVKHVPKCGALEEEIAI